jgi:hypothetical protein
MQSRYDRQEQVNIEFTKYLFRFPGYGWSDRKEGPAERQELRSASCRGIDSKVELPATST